MDATRKESGLRDRHPVTLKPGRRETPVRSDSQGLSGGKKRKRWVVALSVAWMKATSSNLLPRAGARFVFAVLVSAAFFVLIPKGGKSDPSQKVRIFPRVIYIRRNGAFAIPTFDEQRHALEKGISGRRNRSRHREKSEKHEPIHDNEDRCQPTHDWQTTSFPTCNNVHEVDGLMGGVLINNGHFRDVWSFNEFNGRDQAVLKGIRFEYRFTRSDIEKERKDGVAMERLSSSRHIPDIYGYCFGTGIFELSTGGDLMSHVWDESWCKRTTQRDRLTIAVQVAAALADVHAFDIAHTDIAAKQYVLIDGIYKLQDFNRCKLLEWDRQNNETCTFNVGKNPGVSRSPEEYKYKDLTNKIDVYSMGNIFYSLLMEIKVFDGIKSKTAQKTVMRGGRPKLNRTITQSVDPIIIALIRAMRMCQAQQAQDRATAKEVYMFLLSEARKLGVPEILRSADTSAKS
eukprot:CAMPEP_0113534126 /NCGR_PEP_ID=MMETSP0015_2-20120614/4990_1 /TAXON_ID=2838 /ORGANISM="Odontella" /LENGTH=457 /DNA_ID=CAMNT_0000433261 /DNA_START=28 /DNA_END=1401 /DNA_ORIENTATION=+ /assembly_acc=CAM_ASM_000160